MKINGYDIEKEDERFLKKAALGIKILENCRNELYSLFPYLDGAFSCLRYQPEKESKSIATQGEKLCFSPDFLLEMYGKSPAEVRRGYLHILLHCLYLHPFQEGRYEERLWNLSCDIAVELLLERERIPALVLPENDPGAVVRERCFEVIQGRAVSAEQIYELFLKEGFFDDMEKLESAFLFDDHSLWKSENDPLKRKANRHRWERILAYTGQNKEAEKQRAGLKKGNSAEKMEAVCKGRYDYRKYLKKFAVPREEMELDTESFDYIFYHYGMERYGNMPLIEPLEYKEINRLEELVIAIDTSGSCSRETVQQFLGETYRILSEKENFFRKMKVFFIQCDCFIQDVAVIHSREEWDDYSRELMIQGRSGTDFRPVFRYIKEQQEKKEIRQLKALIYFTDGDGIYPREKPDYETAFVFLKKTDSMNMVPAWAVKLLAE